MLGIILAPYGKIPGAYPSEIGFSYGGNGTFLCPTDDALYQTRGEMGWYHDTQFGAPSRKMGFFERLRARRVGRALSGLGLGSVPSDFDLAPTYGWVPMIDGWVSAKEGFNVGSWIPPNGWGPAGGYGPAMAPATYTYPGPLGRLRGLGDSTISVPVPVINASPSAADVQAAANAATDAINQTLQEHQDRMFKLTIISTVVVGLSAMLATLRTWKQLKRDEVLFERRANS